MGRFLEGGTVAVAGGGGVSGAAGSVNPVTGVFGSGQVKWFFEDGSFVVPADVTSVRVRLWGGGSYSGGGFAIKVIDGLASNSSIAVTVGAGSTSGGGTSSFGSHVSATGGGAGNPSTGGSGVGGDFNSSGGDGGAASAAGAGGLFGDGGANGRNGNSGAAGGSNQPGGNGISGNGGGSAPGDVNGSHGILSGLDFISTGGGGGHGIGNGANGGAGGQSGGFPGGGASQVPGAGLVIVEW